MPTLRETKDHIASVRGTLKITSAMKLVASAKLRKAQKTIEALRPYEQELSRIMSSLLPDGVPASPESEGQNADGKNGKGTVAIVAVASNSSMCGGFNSNVSRKVLELISGYEGAVEVHSLGRKVADSMKRNGYLSPSDYSDLVAHPSYESATALARSLAARYDKGELSSVVLVYNKFISTSRQVVTEETFLPFVPRIDSSAGKEDAEKYLLEPGAATIVEEMMPQLMMLRFYAAILDSQASEHAARMLAMQTATDNAEELLSELTREYNKARQQKITSEILDLVAGAAGQ